MKLIILSPCFCGRKRIKKVLLLNHKIFDKNKKRQFKKNALSYGKPMR